MDCKMNWTWVMIAFLFNSCSAVPTSEINTDNEMQISQELCYLRVQLQQCRDQTHLDVKIDGIVRHSTQLDNDDKFVCLPVYCDKSRSSIVGTVTVAVDTGFTEPKEGLSGNVVGLYSLESQCQQENSRFVVITCQPQQQNELLDELMVMSQKDSFMKKCYFQLNAKCNHAMQLSLKVGNRHSTKVYITPSNRMDESSQCVEVSCEGTDDILITGNRITVNPQDLDLSSISLFSSMEECKTSIIDEHSSVTVTCNQQTDVVTQAGAEKMDFNFLQMAMTQGETVAMQWNNDWDGRLKVQCRNTQGISRVRSKNDKKRKDRQWKWDCHKIAKASWDNCYWTNVLNDWDKPFYYQCKPNYVLVGVDSYHNNDREDRRWKFRCCHAPNHFTKGCFVTNYVNDWNGWMDYGVQYPQVFTGAFSYHENKKEDRKWQIEVCEYKHCPGI